MIDLRLGRWQDALADVTCDALICDPPYSARTHNGDMVADWDRERPTVGEAYAALTPEDVRAFVASWAPRVRGWMAVFCDDVLIPAWRDSLDATGRYAFAPVPVIQPRPRFHGDGPGSCAVYLMVARPRSREFLSRCSSLTGWYLAETAGPQRTSIAVVPGAKPLELMRAIVRDYSFPGDLVCDPCAGGATTLLAAAVEGRRGVGAEVDQRTHAAALRRILHGDEALRAPRQSQLFPEGTGPCLSE